MTFYSLNEIHEELMQGGNVVVLTDSPDGHRLEWMRVFEARCNSIGRQCIFLFLRGAGKSTGNISLRDSNWIICDDFSERSEVMSFIGSVQVTNWYFCWDADNWIREISFSKQRIFSLIMRPYLTSCTLPSIFRYLVKFFFVGYLIRVRKIPVFLLRIPMHKSRFLSKHWVDDPNFDLVDFDVNLGEMGTNKYEVKSNKVILVPGFISMRKNPVLAIEVCRMVNSSIGESVQLIFTGKVEDDVLGVLKDCGFDWVVVKDKYLSRADYLKELRASNLVLLLYENIGSSGVVIDCLAYGVPVLLLKNRFWKSLEEESKGLVKLGVKSADKLALQIERMLLRDNLYEFRLGNQSSFKNSTGFDKMFLEIRD